MTKTAKTLLPPVAKTTLNMAGQRRYTHNALLQMLLVFLLLGGVLVWQWDGVQQIYLKNQINVLGWAVNGSIVLLFLCGLLTLVKRFFGYRHEEVNIIRFLDNIQKKEDPMHRVARNCLIAERYRILHELTERYTHVNQNALASALLATESSRNSFVKFVHNALILTGVFGTIISLSFSLLGAADIIHGAGQSSGQGVGFGAMLFGMSTALSTTMTAILAYLIFGYFYIKLTDTQTYLLSRVEQVTAIILLPHLQPTADSVVKDYSDSMRSAGELIEQFAQAQQQYQSSVQSLNDAAESLSQQLSANQRDQDTTAIQQLSELLTHNNQLQQKSATENRELLLEVIDLLQKGFRLPK